MTSIRRASLAILFILLAATLVDPYGWAWYPVYDFGIHTWWKFAISGLDVLLLTLLAFYVSAGRWGRALWLSRAELGFAATAGLFIAHLDLIRNAMEIAWLPGLRVLLGLYVATLALRLALVLLLRRAVNRTGDTAAAMPLPAEQALRSPAARPSSPGERQRRSRIRMAAVTKDVKRRPLWMRGMLAGFGCGVLVGAFLEWYFNWGPGAANPDSGMAHGLVLMLLGFPTTTLLFDEIMGLVPLPVFRTLLVLGVGVSWGLLWGAVSLLWARR